MNDHLLERFDALHDKVLDFIEQADSNQWQMVTADEGWKVGVTAHHIGAIHYPVIDQVQLMIESAPLTTTTLADIDRLNEAHVHEYTNVTPEQTKAFLLAEGTRVRSWLAGLTQTQLELTADIDFMGGEVTAERLLNVVLFELAEGHFESIRKTTRGNTRTRFAASSLKTS